MGNEQSAQVQSMPETGLRLSTLCRYQTETGNEEGLGFNWFQASTDVSGLVLKGAHRWGYVLSYGGGQRLFKDTKQRFFVLLDHYMCYFDTHTPDARMKGSIDLDKSDCQLELLPSPPTSVSAPERLIRGVLNPNAPPDDDISDYTSSGNEEHRVEVTRKSDDWSIVLCFSNATELQSWMKSIFDVQQRKATFSPLLRHRMIQSAPKEDSGEDSSGVGRQNGDEWVDGLESRPRSGNGDGRGGGHRTGGDTSGCTELQRRDDDGGGRSGADLGVQSGRSGRTPSCRRHRRRRNRRRGTLYSPPRPVDDERSSTSRGSVPLFWANSEDGDEQQQRRRPASRVEAVLGKPSERLAALPRGGRAAGGDGINSSLDEYGAFTTAHASIYEGWTRGLQAHGWGRMICAHGDYVEGWWEHDVLEGSGEHRSREEGWTYRGGFVGGERHGPGRLVTAEGEVWECEWRHGVVATGVSGTHTSPNGELFQGGCAPSSENPMMPCRAGHGRLRRRDGEQVETHFRVGRPVDGAKGVVRFRNGAIFFGQLQDARPHGYGELYLSSVKPDVHGRSLADLDAMGRNILWYKGNFNFGKAHGSGLVKYKDPLASRRGSIPPLATPPGPGTVSPVPDTGEGVITSRNSSGPPIGDGDDVAGVSYAPLWGESKEEGRLISGGSRGLRGDGIGGQRVLQLSPMDDEEGEEDEEEEDGEAGDGEGDGVGAETSDSEEEEEEEDEEEDEEEGGGEGGAGQGEEGSAAERRRSLSGWATDAGEERPTLSTPRPRERPLDDSGVNAAGWEVDMEYEAAFVEGVMVQHDPTNLRLAALKFGRAEIRRLETLLRKEEEAMARLHSRSLCLLCNAEEMNALLLGCRHRVLCMGCSARTDSCPVCHEPISKVVRTFST